jgi:hypothetical protein
MIHPVVHALHLVLHPAQNDSVRSQSPRSGRTRAFPIGFLLCCPRHEPTAQAEDESGCPFLLHEPLLGRHSLSWLPQTRNCRRTRLKGSGPRPWCGNTCPPIRSSSTTHPRVDVEASRSSTAHLLQRLHIKQRKGVQHLRSLLFPGGQSLFVSSRATQVFRHPNVPGNVVPDPFRPGQVPRSTRVKEVSFYARMCYAPPGRASFRYW